jgi:serine/threonine protein phosphatase PrpC
VVTEILRELLTKTGYCVIFRGGLWTECFVSSGSENWQGRGSTENDALEDVMRQMMPSALARHLLEQHGSPSPEAIHDGSLPPEAPAQAVTSPPIPTTLAPLADVAPAAPPAPEPDAMVSEALQDEATCHDPRPELPVTSPLTPPPPEPPALSAPEEPPVEVAAAPPPEAAPVTVEAAPAPRAEARAPRFEAAGKTDRGVERPHNEDAFAVLPEHGLFIVADGLGAHNAGEIASALAVETVRRTVEGAAALPASRRKGLPLLVEAVERANAEIFAAAGRDPKLRGMGTTIAAALSAGRQVALAHVGDSRIYRLHRGILELLTTDHSLTNQRLRSGDRSGARGSLITRALGTHPTVEVDTSSVTRQAGDLLLLCTDGLHGVVMHEEISDLLCECKDPDAAVERLVERANAKGGPDNVTAVVIRWGSLKAGQAG